MRGLGHKLLWAAAAVLVLAVAAWFIPTGDVAYVPGVTGNLKDMVTVAERKPSPAGKLLMVAIGILPVNALLYLGMRWNPAYEIQPESLVLPDMTMQQFVAINYAMMDQSQEQAAVDGERLAGLDARTVVLAGVEVEALLAGGAAVGHLRVGDRIVAVDGHPVTLSNLHGLLAHYRVGSQVTLTVVRRGKTLAVPIRLRKMADDPSPAVGIAVGTPVQYLLPRPVTFHVSSIGGPSAGMMFALEIYQQITGRDLSHGQIIAGTGELGPDDHIEEIGGVGQKVVTVADAGAKLFLCPLDNYAKAATTARLLHLHLRIEPVSTLQQALRDLEHYS